MSERCVCRFDHGQTVIIKWQEQQDGSRAAVCCRCQGDVSWRLQSYPMAGVNRIQGKLQDPAEWHDHPVHGLDVSLFGQAAVSCSVCGRLTFWRGSPARLSFFCEDVLRHGDMQLPCCGAVIDIPGEWMVMFT